MSSYPSLLSLSPVDQIGRYVNDGGDDDDMAVAASYLSFDIDVGEEYYPPVAAAAAISAFHSEQQAPAPAAPFLASPQADSDSYKSGRAASSGGGESSLESRLELAMQNGSQGLSNHDMIDMGFTSGGGGGGARSLARSRSSKIAFKTRSEVEVLDDGYRWRKYGKKMVKNSPNPRNYYRCSSEGCRVKKRVERERDDARFVITSYDGVHEHPAPLPPRGCAGYSLGQPQGRRAEEGSQLSMEGRSFLETMKPHAAGAAHGGPHPYRAV